MGPECLLAASTADKPSLGLNYRVSALLQELQSGIRYGALIFHQQNGLTAMQIGLGNSVDRVYGLGRNGALHAGKVDLEGRALLASL